MILADIASGHLLLADWLFLIAAVLAVLAAIGHAPKVVTPILQQWAASLLALAVACVAFAWLVL